MRKNVDNGKPLTDKSVTFNLLYKVFFIVQPCIYFKNIVDPVLIPRQLFLSVFVFLLFLMIVLSKARWNMSYLTGKPVLAFIVFFLCYLLSIFFANTISEALYVSSKIGIELVFLILTAHLIYNKELLPAQLIQGIVMMVFVTCCIALYQVGRLYFSGQDIFKNVNDIVSTNGHKNQFSSFLYLCFPFVLCIVLYPQYWISNSTQQRLWRTVAYSLIICIILLTWLLQTRAAILGYLVMCIVAIILYAIFQKERDLNKQLINSLKKRWLFSMIVFGLVIILSSVSMLDIIQFTKQTMIPDPLKSNETNKLTLLTNTHSIESRYIIWKKTLNIIREHPFGVGAGNWQVFFPAEGLSELNNIESDLGQGILHFQRPHNDLLWIWSETGFAGILAYLAIVVFTFKGLLRKLNNENTEEIFLFYLLLISSFAGYLFISISDFPFERIEHQVVVLLIISFATAMPNPTPISILTKAPPSEKIETLQKNYSIAFKLLLIPVVFSIVVCLYRFSGERHTLKLIEAQHRNDWPKMKKEGEQALSVFYSMDPMSTPINWYIGVAAFYMNDAEGSKNYFLHALKIHPNHLHVLNNLASCYEKSGKHDTAIKYYKKALRISPEFREAKLNLCGAYYNSGDFENAFNLIDTYPPDTSNTKYMTFLQAILLSKVNSIIKNRNLPANIFEQKAFNSYLCLQYFASRRNKIDFEAYLLKNDSLMQ